MLRAFEVLRIINERDRATVTEIHRSSGLPKPTILRMIETLIAAGYVARENDRPAYVATGKCLLLSNGFRVHDRLTAVAAPMLAAFRRKIGWPSDFGIFDGDAMVIAATSRDLGVLVAQSQDRHAHAARCSVRSGGHISRSATMRNASASSSG